MPRRKKPGRKPGPRPGAAGALSGAVASLRSALTTLVAERANLERKIATLENAIGIVGGGPVTIAAPRAAATRGGRGGRRREGSLKSFIEQVLRSSGGIMAVKDITSGVMSAGYKTKNKTLAKSVGIALTEMKNVQKVGRGKFRVK
jgi:hypothetical protein